MDPQPRQRPTWKRSTPAWTSWLAKLPFTLSSSRRAPAGNGTSRTRYSSSSFGSSRPYPRTNDSSPRAIWPSGNALTSFAQVSRLPDSTEKPVGISRPP